MKEGYVAVVRREGERKGIMWGIKGRDSGMGWKGNMRKMVEMAMEGG